MKSTKKLLSITNLKKYFPVGKPSAFHKEQLYVRANEDISLDIYEGETLGIVGESGCGKSTLGRVLLQLYPQTAGTTMYYGSSLRDMAPDYWGETLKNLEKHRHEIKKLTARAEELDRKTEEAGGEEKADFYLLQDRNLARSELQTAESHLTKLLGGFYTVEDDSAARELMLRIYQACVRRRDQTRKYQELRLSCEHLMADSAKNQSKIDALSREMESQKQVIAGMDADIAGLDEQLEALKAPYRDNAGFQACEKLLDDGVDLSRLTYNEMRLLRQELQIIFQDPYSSLNPRFTIGQIIEEGLVTHNFYKHGSEQMRAHIVDTMEKCGLQEYMLHRYPHQFSGGQRQRVAIARALAVHPKFIVCDECVSALDVSIQSQIINLLQELKEKEHLTYMFISHDLSVVRYISDRICVMYLGNVVELADAATIFSDPRHPYTVALLSSIPTTDPDSADKERIILEGSIPSPIKPPSGCKFHTRCYMACEKCKRVPPELREVEPGHFLACHFPEKKLDENGKFLFAMPKMKGVSAED